MEKFRKGVRKLSKNIKFFLFFSISTKVLSHGHNLDGGEPSYGAFGFFGLILLLILLYFFDRK